MSSEQSPDAVVLEDTPEEIGRIRQWLLIDPLSSASELIGSTEREDELLSDDVGPMSAVVLRPPSRETQIAITKREIIQQIEKHDPCVLIVDWLLSGESGDEIGGFDVSILCKEKWPEMGVVVVTTGGDGDLEFLMKGQQELDQELRHMNPVTRPDFAWIKPWGPSARLDRLSRGDSGIDYRKCVRELVNRSKRPSEH